MTAGADIVVVGAGPAGMAAVCAAAQSGFAVTVLDDNPTAGGQIWRGGHANSNQASYWRRRFRSSPASTVWNAQIISADSSNKTLLAESSGRPLQLRWKKLILATGSREIFLPFPGWTLPGVMGVGGLQALVKSGLPVDGKRIVVAGSGPLLLAAAAYFRQQDALVPLVVEQAPWPKLARFAAGLASFPRKAWQAAILRASLGGASYLHGWWIQQAEGRDRVEQVRISNGTESWEEPCDYAAVAYGLYPNTELASLLGCAIENRAVKIDEFQRTSIEGVYCAGEATGIGGVDLSLVEGQIAGLATTNKLDAARALFRKRERQRDFARLFAKTFALRPELKELATDETLVCRCEDVPFGRVRDAGSWRAAKLHTRCGMGPCQGRVCGPALDFLCGWPAESVRVPIFPARIGTLILDEAISKGDN